MSAYIYVYIYIHDDFSHRNQTPAMAQWWQFKAQNMDTVLFFKVGKFYELFHMDSGMYSPFTPTHKCKVISDLTHLPRSCRRHRLL